MDKDVSIVAGPSSVDLANQVARCLGAELVTVDFRIFKDGETKINMKKPAGRNCILIQSTYPPTDRHLLQALMMLKRCSDDGSVNISAVVPYMAYSRQDREFLEGEVVSMALVARLFESVGTRRLITMDIHSTFSLSYFSINVRNLSAVKLLANYLITNIKPCQPIVVSPDKGGATRAIEFANFLSTDVFALSKRREVDSKVFFDEQKLSFDIAGRDVVILDDMISTGESIVKASEFLTKHNPKNIYAMCTHALMIDDALGEIKAAGVKEIISTNSIPGETAKVDLSPVISKEIINIIQKEDLR